MHISIPKPCNEDWNKMQPADQGAFCKSCCKTVIDFTNKSAAQIKDFFEAMKGQKVCGRFRTEQLQPAPVTSGRKQRLSRFLCALYLVFGAFLFTACGNDNVVGKVQRDTTRVLGDSVGEPLRDTTARCAKPGVSDSSSTVKTDRSFTLGGPVVTPEDRAKIGEVYAAPGDSL